MCQKKLLEKILRDTVYYVIPWFHAGSYSISVMVGSTPVLGSPFNVKCQGNIHGAFTCSGKQWQCQLLMDSLEQKDSNEWQELVEVLEKKEEPEEEPEEGEGTQFMFEGANTKVWWNWLLLRHPSTSIIISTAFSSRFNHHWYRWLRPKSTKLTNNLLRSLSFCFFFCLIIAQIQVLWKSKLVTVRHMTATLALHFLF